jgi:hypothetical protein
MQLEVSGVEILAALEFVIVVWGRQEKATGGLREVCTGTT